MVGDEVKARAARPPLPASVESGLDLLRDEVERLDLPGRALLPVEVALVWGATIRLPTHRLVHDAPDLVLAPVGEVDLQVSHEVLHGLRYSCLVS